MDDETQQGDGPDPKIDDFIRDDRRSYIRLHDDEQDGNEQKCNNELGDRTEMVGK